MDKLACHAAQLRNQPVARGGGEVQQGRAGDGLRLLRLGQPVPLGLELGIGRRHAGDRLGLDAQWKLAVALAEAADQHIDAADAIDAQQGVADGGLQRQQLLRALDVPGVYGQIDGRGAAGVFTGQ